MALCKSEDSGATWGSRCTLTSPNGECCDIAVAPSNYNIVYAVGYDGYYPNYEARVFRSSNAGSTWSNVTSNLSSLDTDMEIATSVQVHPDSQDIVFVGTDRGVFLSRNGGTSWGSAGLSGYSIQVLIYDDFNKVLFAITRYEGVFYTENSGTVWEPLNNGLEYMNIQCADLDPTYHILYIGRYSGGIWRMDLNGFKTEASENWILYD